MSFSRKPPALSGRKKKLTRLSGLTENLISPALRKKSQYLSQLIAHWPQIAGSVSDWAQPSDLRPATSADNDGTLILSIHSGRGPQALAMGPEIIERVNRHFGFALICYVNVKQDLPHKAPDKQRSPRSDKAAPAAPSQSLEEALDKLGKALGVAKEP